MGDWLVNDSLSPTVAGVIAPLYEHAARGLLAMPFCNACDAVCELGQIRCDLCGSANPLAWRVVQPVGTIHSATMVHRLEPGLILTGAPYPVVDVELVSGHRIIMTTAESCSSLPQIGDAANVVFRNVAHIAVPSLSVIPEAES